MMGSEAKNTGLDIYLNKLILITRRGEAEPQKGELTHYDNEFLYVNTLRNTIAIRRDSVEQIKIARDNRRY
jgi:hypothetical protein